MINATIMKNTGIVRSGTVVNAFSSNTRSYYTPSICKSGNKIIRDNMMFRFQSSKLRQNVNPILLSRTQKLYFHTSSSPASIIPYTRGILLSAMDDDEEEKDEETVVIDVDRTWNVGGLRKEVSRLTVRCHKKVGKASQRLQKAQEEVDRLTGSEGVTMEELEKCPNVDEFETQLEELRSRLTQLNQLEVLLQDIKGKKTVLSDHIATLAIKLEVQDETPTKPERGPKKEKGPTTMAAFRLPYRRFYTSDKTEIRVGKQAEDNDELSTSPEHRDGSDWWMHASGCPGSHVVIRCHDHNLDDAVVMDAAALAARQSKCNGNVIKVSMTRARDVKKPSGAKAGLVQLTGQVRTVVVNMKEAQALLDRLDETVLIN